MRETPRRQSFDTSRRERERRELEELREELLQTEDLFVEGYKCVLLNGEEVKIKEIHRQGSYKGHLTVIREDGKELLVAVEKTKTAQDFLNKNGR